MRSATVTASVSAAGKDEFVDLTDELRRAVKDSGVTTGLVIAYCMHTTCGLIINEWEDGALADLKARLLALVPPDAYYAHDDLHKRTQNLVEDERANGRSHVAQMIVGGTSHALPVISGEPLLGRWQRLFLFEQDEPKERSIVFHVLGT